MNTNGSGPAEQPSAAAMPGGGQVASRGRLAALGVVCLAIMGLWVWIVEPAGLDSHSDKPYYNLLVQGFQAGQLNLKLEAPAKLAHLADPYDPAANSPCWVDGVSLHDTSYYQGKLYMYFGVTPAVTLFWPYAALTGRYLSQEVAVLIFCAAGFLASAGLLYALWRRCFPGAGFGVVLAGVVALGLASGLPMLMSRSSVYEVAISCGYAFVMVSLACVWGVRARPTQAGWWLAGASLAYGLAVGARPNLLFGAGLLLIPPVQAWRNGQRPWRLGLAAAGPLLGIGLALMVYNQLRFGNPLEFGHHYQLDLEHRTVQDFSLRYLWFNGLVYFLNPVHWSLAYPFVREGILTAVPKGYSTVELGFNILADVPVVWLGLAALPLWRAKPALRGFLAATACFGAASMLTLCCFVAANDRYEVEFLPALVLLGVVGILNLEQAPGRRRWLVRSGWGLLLVFSAGFNLVHAVERRALICNDRGVTFATEHQMAEAIEMYRQATFLAPDYADPHFNLGTALSDQGQLDGALREYQEVLRLKPDYALVHYDLGVIWQKTGRLDEAVREYQETIRLNPDYGLAQAHYNLGIVYIIRHRLDLAVAEFQTATRIKPDYADAYFDLGTVLMELGRVDEAVQNYKEAVRLNPAAADAYNSLNRALAARDDEIRQLVETIRQNPGDADAHYNLGNMFYRRGQMGEAIHEFQEVLRQEPNSADACNNLGIALTAQGRRDEAIQQFQKAVSLKPDFADAQKNLAALLEKKRAGASAQ
jgi:tetratricopeptide (TPR) repeat protein